MKTVTTNVYLYSELSDKAKEKARSWRIDRMTVEDWSEFVIDDAGNIELKITEWDIYRGTIGGELEYSGERVAANILREHGDSCDTFGVAKKYTENRAKIIADGEKDENGDLLEEYPLESLDDEFRRELLECYLVALRNEYEYQTSEEVIAETMEANEYTFTADGKRFG